jgi:hypothetical protein
VAGYYIEYESEVLAFRNSEANDPYEPYQAVSALWNADLATIEPAWAPREHWIVDSAHQIPHRPVEEILAEAESVE